MAQLPAPRDYHAGFGRGPLGCPKNFLCSSRTATADLDGANCMHERCVLFLNFGTAATVYLDQREIPVAEHQGLLFFPFQRHHYASLAVPVQWLFITFDLPEAGWLSVLRNRPVPLTDHEIASARDILDSYAAGAPAQPQYLPLRFAVGTLLARLCTAATNLPSESPQPPNLSTGKGTLLSRLNKFIWADLAGDLSCDTMARQVGMSASHLRLLVRKQICCGPGTYVRRIRMKRAMTLLAENRYSIGEVAACCGLGGPATLSRAFRVHTGLTPRPFRQQQRGPSRQQQRGPSRQQQRGPSRPGLVAS